jgi:hypothetical protein
MMEQVKLNRAARLSVLLEGSLRGLLIGIPRSVCTARDRAGMMKGLIRDLGNVLRNIAHSPGID